MNQQQKINNFFIIFSQMRRVAPNRGQQRQSPRIVIFDAEEDLTHKCCICFQAKPKLISPCLCGMRYHQLCLLKYIKERLEAMRNQIDLTQLRCQRCKQQLKFLYFQHNHWGCGNFCAKLQRSFCQKILVILVVLLVAILVIAIILTRHSPSDGGVYAGLLVALSVLIFIFVVLLLYCVQRNLTHKQIVLVRMYQYAQLVRNNTSSSQDSPQYQLHSASFEVVIDENH